MRVAVLGAGAVGARAARQLAASDDVTEIVVSDIRPDRASALAVALGEVARHEPSTSPAALAADAVILATTSGHHGPLALALLEQGSSVVSVSDAVEDVEALLALDADARRRGLYVVVGAGFSPGLTDVLASHAAANFDRVDEVHVAKSGTAGPECARQHHRALAGAAIDWRDGGWQRRPGGSGRELCWFPDPVGAQDCYRAALPDALLLTGAFPGVGRATARVAATRRDRLTARLPMLRRPHREGTVGAVRVEVRGRKGPASDVAVLGAIDRPAVAAGAVAALAAVLAARSELRAPGAAGLGQSVEPVPFLAELARRGVRAAVFEGATHMTDAG